ncbi:MAG: fimbria major subunit [Muribaculaceae bacterium]|nr:fimbria major subunit [Muribaculaceae bacterium]
MIKHNIFTCVLACALLSLCACVDENFNLDDTRTDNKFDYSGEKVTRYFSFRLNMADGVPYTRVSYGGVNNDTYDQEFEDGSAASESYLKNFIIIFYDSQGTYLTHFASDSLTKIEPPKPDKETDSDDPENSDDSTGSDNKDEDDDNNDDEGNEEIDDKIVYDSIEDISWGKDLVVKLQLYNEVFLNKDEVSYFVITNYNDYVFKDNNGSLSGKITDNGKIKSRNELAKTQLNTVKGSDSYFLMTTAGRFEMDEPSKNYNYCFYDKGEPDKIFYTSPLEAYYNPVVVYVERLAAKVTLEKISKIEPVEVLWGTGVYSLNFIPLGWGIEGEEEESYLIKHSKNLDYYSIENGYHSDFYQWINYHDEGSRTFWAESPSYIFDTDQKFNTYPATGIETSGLTLKYQTFEKLLINEDEFKEEKYTDLDNNFSFIKERTFSSIEFDTSKVPGQGIDNPYAVPTSFVLTGYYKEAKWVRSDEKDGVDVEHPDGITPDSNTSPKNGDDLNFNEAGFYLRYIDMERTDKESESVDEDGNTFSDPKRYKYRLYREKDGNGNNELLAALLKEQYTLFIERTVTHHYLDDQDLDENGKPKVKEEQIVTYIPVKATTTYYTDENKKETAFIKDKLFGVYNTYTIWNEVGNEMVKTDASNTYTLQLNNNEEIQTTINEINKGLAKDEVVLNQTLNGTIYRDTANEILVFGKYKEDEKKGEYNALSKDNIDDANEILQQTLGYAQFYWQGKAFFYSPITHYSGEDNPFHSNNPYKGLFNYKAQYASDGTLIKYLKDSKGKYIPSHKPGDFGVVRNHIYNFKIDGISSIGYGIPAEDVIPLPEPRINHDIYQFDLELKILPWNIFEYYLDI